MNEATRKSLVHTLRIALNMLPRYLRHDLWRICEPQHQEAVERVTDAIVGKIDDGFEVEAKPPPPAHSFAYLYRGPGERE